MQHPIIFLASQDPSFAITAVSAAIETRHLPRQAHSFEEATGLLADDTHNFAVVLIDADPTFHGLDLLLGFARTDPSFPLLVIIDAQDTKQLDLPFQPWKTISRRVSARDLAQEIRNACAASEVLSR